MNRCALILTHGRAKHCVTIGTLRRCGYTGEIVLLLDDEDESANEYRKNYPECKILTFCKQDEMARPFASVDNFGIRGTVLYARNAAWEIMRREGYDEFIMLDDDYSQFQHRWLKNDYLGYMGVRNLDEVFGVFFQFLRDANADVVCFAQGGGLYRRRGFGDSQKVDISQGNERLFFQDKKTVLLRWRDERRREHVSFGEYARKKGVYGFIGCNRAGRNPAEKRRSDEDVCRFWDL